MIQYNRQGRNQIFYETPKPVLYPEHVNAKGTAAGFAALLFCYEKTDRLHINPSAAHYFRVFPLK